MQARPGSTRVAQAATIGLLAAALSSPIAAARPGIDPPAQPPSVAGAHSIMPPEFRPDAVDRFGATHRSEVPSLPTSSTSGERFAWDSAAIGAGGGAALVLAATGTATLARRHRRLRAVR